MTMTPCFADERYDVTVLPFVPFSDTGGEALNKSGVVVGGVAGADGSVSLAQWTKGVLTHLDVPSATADHDFNRPRVFGINDCGAVVGTVHTAAGVLPSRWFIYDRGCFTVLPLADPTDLGGAAIGINSRGEVVGYNHTSSKRLVAWLWSNGVYSKLPVSGTSTAALAINSGGTIIGNRRLRLMRRVFTGQWGRTGERGFVISHDATRYLPGFVNAINDRDEMAGGTISEDRVVAAIFNNGIPRVILGLPSSAVGINSAATVVGSYQPAGDDRRRLFGWSADSGAFDLTPEGYCFAQAAAIDERGEILGFGETLSGESQYFLLTPHVNGVLTPRALVNGAAGGRATRATR
jgi:probable HAF family extracellular repeat protein